MAALLARALYGGDGSKLLVTDADVEMRRVESLLQSMQTICGRIEHFHVCAVLCAPRVTLAHTRGDEVHEGVTSVPRSGRCHRGNVLHICCDVHGIVV